MKQTVFTAFAVVSLVFVVAGCTESAGTVDEVAETVISRFAVDGMTCGGCELAVKAKVGELDGVVGVEASYQEGSATVTYEPGRVAPAAIAAAIRELGYTAEPIAEGARGASSSPSTGREAS